MKYRLVLAGIVIIGFLIRIWGLNWDSGQHLHPDERFLTMVAVSLSWPEKFTDYFSTSISTLNPQNVGHNFYVYGTWPVILVKAVAEIVGKESYAQLVVVGRVLSAFFDAAVILLVAAIARNMTGSNKSGLLTASVYSLSVLPIQHSHYFTVDSFTVFCGVFFFYFTIKQVLSGKINYAFSLGAGFAAGMAFSGKLSSIVIVPIYILLIIDQLKRHLPRKSILASLCIFSGALLGTIRIAYPYLFSGLFSLNERVITNWKQLSFYNQPNLFYPPATLWIHIMPGLFPLQNMLVWGMGITAGIAFVASAVFLFLRLRNHWLYSYLLAPLVLVFVYQSTQLPQPMRYFYLLYPFAAMCIGVVIPQLKRRIAKSVGAAVVVGSCVWAVSFLSIYSQPHTRIKASQWVYDHIPQGSTISCEYWDDCIPLPLSSSLTPYSYKIAELSLYPLETKEKWAEIISQLESTQYIIISSNRVYGSLGTLPDAYPITNNFYSALFDGTLGFKLVAQFTSRPGIAIPGVRLCLTPPTFSYGNIALPVQKCDQDGVWIVDDYADETFTVYDHPKVLIFAKEHPAPYQDIVY